MWEILLHPNVDAFLEKLDSALRDRIKGRLKKLREDPFLYLEHHESRDYYKFRVGDYRALIDVDFQRKTLKVQHLDHRSRVYKR